MYKTVDFNIFEQLLDEIVYGKQTAVQTVEPVTIKKATVTKIGEVTIPKITDQKTRKLVYKHFELSEKAF